MLRGGHCLSPRGHGQYLMHDDENKGARPTAQQGVEAGSALSIALSAGRGGLKAGLMTSAEI